MVGGIAATSGASLFAEVSEIRGSKRHDIIVISRCRSRSLFEASPAWVVTFGKINGAASFISVVAHGEYRTGNVVDKFGGQFSAIESTRCNIARANQHRIAALLCMCGRSENKQIGD